MPIQSCTVKGKPGKRWGQSGKCYAGAAAKAKALRQARAILATGWTENAAAPVKKRRPNPLKADPTRTATVRRKFLAEMSRRFDRLRKDVVHLLLEEDAFGLVHAEAIASPTKNQRFMFQTRPEQVDAFRRWLKRQVALRIIGDENKVGDEWWEAYVQEGYRQGAGRAFEDTKRRARGQVRDFYDGTKQEFLRSSFGRPVTVEKTKLLAGRVYSDLKGVTDAMSTKMVRTLTDGLVQGKNPRVIAKDLSEDVAGIGRKRAEVIARTEIIRTHAEGQLDAFEELGVTEVGVAAEWLTAGDDLVCEECAPMEGVVMKVEEARNLLPRHPNCLPGDCLVLPGSRVVATSERHYEGDLVVIRTTSGRELTCTPNHPVMTNLGWLPAKALYVGCYVVCDGRRQWESVHNDKDDHVPACIEEVARALRESRGMVAAEVPLAAPDFHGDATDGQVAVIRTDCRLLLGYDSPVTQHIQEPDLVPRDVVNGVRLPGNCPTGLLGDAPLAPAGSRVGSNDLPSALPRPHPRPLNQLGLALVAHVNAVRLENAPDYPTPDIVPCSDLVLRLPYGIQFHNDMIEWASRNLAVLPALDNVVSVGLRKYNGHVYNLQTLDGWYTANGIITHNCRCAWIPANVGESEEDQIRSQKAVEGAIDESLDAEGRGDKTTWPGADTDVDKERPESVLSNVFCATGEGGGIDPTCSPGSPASSPVRSIVEQAIRAVDSLPKSSDGRIATHPLRRDPEDVYSHWNAYDTSTPVPKTASVVDVPIDLVDAEEHYLYPGKVKEYIRDPLLGGPGTALSGGGRYYLLDGNHRLIAAYLRGEKTIKLRVAAAELEEPLI